MARPTPRTKASTSRIIPTLRQIRCRLRLGAPKSSIPNDDMEPCVRDMGCYPHGQIEAGLTFTPDIFYGIFSRCHAAMEMIGKSFGEFGAIENKTARPATAKSRAISPAR